MLDRSRDATLPNAHACNRCPDAHSPITIGQVRALAVDVIGCGGTCSVDVRLDQ